MSLNSLKHQAQAPLCTLEIGPPKEQNTLQRTVTKIVPSSDTFCTKKRKAEDKLTEIYIKQSEQLNNIARQVTETLSARNNIEPTRAIDQQFKWH